MARLLAFRGHPHRHLQGFRIHRPGGSAARLLQGRLLVVQEAGCSPPSATPTGAFKVFEFVAGILWALVFVAGIFKTLKVIAGILKALGFVASILETLKVGAGILQVLEFVAGVLQALEFVISIFEAFMLIVQEARLPAILRHPFVMF